jgi:quinol monooxygenase YgiN
MVTVVAHYRARQGAGQQVADALLQHVAATRREPGCRTFVATRAVDDPDRFVLFEQYDDETAFQAHRATPHFRRYVEEMVVPLLEERAWQRYRETGGPT